MFQKALDFNTLSKLARRTKNTNIPQFSVLSSGRSKWHAEIKPKMCTPSVTYRESKTECRSVYWSWGRSLDGKCCAAGSRPDPRAGRRNAARPGRWRSWSDSCGRRDETWRSPAGSGRTDWTECEWWTWSPGTASHRRPAMKHQKLKCQSQQQQQQQQLHPWMRGGRAGVFCRHSRAYIWTAKDILKLSESLTTRRNTMSTTFSSATLKW